MTSAALRGALRSAFERAVVSIDLEARVAKAMPRTPARVRAGAVVAIGKAAPAMAKGALSVVDRRFTRVLVVAPDGTEAVLRDPRVEVLRAAHPDPDARSVRAARRALEVVAVADHVVALVSGGASSLACMPEGVTLARYVRIVRALLLGGAGVRDVNAVRRRLCGLKGGGLARAARGAVVTLVASDIIGGGACDVGSGPTMPDPTTAAQARAIVARYAPRLAPPPMRRTLAPGDPLARGLRARFVARPEDLAGALARELRAVLPRVRVLAPSTAAVEAMAAEYAALAQRLRPGEALVRSAEPAVHVGVARPGRGGRCTHLAALVGPALPRGIAFLAGASDGVDGASGTAGAVVDGSLGGAALARAVAAFATGPLLAARSFALPSRPTGINLADVHVLARTP